MHRAGFGGSTDTSASYIEENGHSTYTEEDGYEGRPGWCTHLACGYSHHTFICHRLDVKHTCKQCNLDCFNKMGIVVESYLGVTHTPLVDTIIKLLYVTNIMSNTHVNNAT